MLIMGEVVSCMSESVKQILCSNIARLMDENNINGVQLAKLLGVSEAIVSRWVNGKSAPEYDLIDKMRSVLGWTLADLYEHNHKESPAVTKLELSDALRTVVDACGFEKPRLKKKST